VAALAPHWLADKSALSRMPHPAVERRLRPLLVEGLIATCRIVDLDVGYSAQTAADHEAVRRERRALPLATVDDAVLDRALDVQGVLAERGEHRLPIPDLVIAAAAEHAGLAVLHYDADFDRIAAVTGQPCEWVVPRGTV
jgi:predicted nucleic acid-binding protein